MEIEELILEHSRFLYYSCGETDKEQCVMKAINKFQTPDFVKDLYNLYGISIYEYAESVSEIL